jgi:hypothetical protein
MIIKFEVNAIWPKDVLINRLNPCVINNVFVISNTSGQKLCYFFHSNIFQNWEFCAQYKLSKNFSENICFQILARSWTFRLSSDAISVSNRAQQYLIAIEIEDFATKHNIYLHYRE